MPNILGFEPLADPSWIQVKFDDGSVSNPVQDPSGEYRNELTNVAAKLMGGGAQSPTPSVSPAAPAPEAFVAPPQPLANPIFTPPVGAPAPNTTTPEGRSVFVPPTAPVVAPPTPLLATTPKPVVSAPLSPPATPRGMVRSGVSVGTQGMVAEDQAKVEGLNSASLAAQGASNDENIRARTEQLNADWNRLTESEKAKLAEIQLKKDQEARYTEKFDAQVEENRAIAARPVDPSQAFAGDAGAYAFMAAFGDAIANFGANLAGRQGTADPMRTLNTLIDRSVTLQTRQKQEDFNNGKITADQLEAERERVRLKLGAAQTQLADTQLQRAQTEKERMGLVAAKKAGEAMVADAAAKNAAALARHETRSDTFELPKPAVAAGMTPMQLLEYEKKALDLRNAKIDAADADLVSEITGIRMSPELAKDTKNRVKEAGAEVAKTQAGLSFTADLVTELGGTMNVDTGDIKWEKDLKGAGPIDAAGGALGVFPVTAPFVQGARAAGIYQADTDKVKDKQAALREYVTKNLTGATASPSQQQTFAQMTGGSLKNETQTKASIEAWTKGLVQERQSQYGRMGPGGKKLYDHVANESAQSTGLKEVGKLPPGQF